MRKVINLAGPEWEPTPQEIELAHAVRALTLKARADGVENPKVVQVIYSELAHLLALVQPSPAAADATARFGSYLPTAVERVRATYVATLTKEPMGHA